MLEGLLALKRIARREERVFLAGETPARLSEPPVERARRPGALADPVLRDRIAQAENIEVSDQEIEQEIASMADQTQQPAEAVSARLTREGALDRIRNRLRHDKAIVLLFRHTV